MNLFSMINVYDEHTEYKAQNSADRLRSDKDSGLTIYDSLEHNKRYLKETNFAFKMEILRSFIR